MKEVPVLERHYGSFYARYPALEEKRGQYIGQKTHPIYWYVRFSIRLDPLRISQ